MKRVIWLIIFLLGVTGSPGFCSETYSIDQDSVLLYKVINWWYDCLPEEAFLLCGSKVTCKNQGNTRVQYDESKMELCFRINGGFAHQLSISAPSYFKCIWLNHVYFTGSQAETVSTQLPVKDGLLIRHVGKDAGQLIQSMEKEIVFELEGVIHGLMDGKIALNPEGDFIKTCSGAPRGRDIDSPVSLSILIPRTKEVLARYQLVF